MKISDKITINYSQLYGDTTDILGGPSHEAMATALIKKTPLVFPDTEGNKHSIVLKVLLEDEVLADRVTFLGIIQKDDSSQVAVLGTMQDDKNGWGFFREFRNH